LKATLIADSIGKSFGDRRILTSARLAALPGEITILAGRNGSGKSTLMKICAGVQRADYGWVELGGRRMMHPRLHQLARLGLFYLPDRAIFMPSHTIASQLAAMSARFNGIGIEAVTQSLSLDSLLDRRPQQLSPGELRRCEVALGMIRRPQCFVADEPLRGIDPRDRDLILRAFRTCANAGSAVVLSGHENNDLLDAADAVVWVYAGTTSPLGRGSDARRNDRFCRDYLTGTWTSSPATISSASVATGRQH
jgi:ABC-type multidrug transport system ATPase subunit